MRFANLVALALLGLPLLTSCTPEPTEEDMRVVYETERIRILLFEPPPAAIDSRATLLYRKFPDSDIPVKFLTIGYCNDASISFKDHDMYLRYKRISFNHSYKDDIRTSLALHTCGPEDTCDDVDLEDATHLKLFCETD